ncbi:hypothetical protein [Parageobacillus galactosidasius]|uniref:hypothetical protein n=1 Tax=Parageobacillus galactosidasius TaxID=883812 RepID=UPI00113270F1|nr:hypothetical protein [Parageobacillus galactosidasius]
MFENMFESEFERKIRENYEIWDSVAPETMIEAMHPYFCNSKNREWIYPPRPTIHAMYLFGKLNKELTKKNIPFDMAVEVCVRKKDTVAYFIDIAIWCNKKKYAIEVHTEGKYNDNKTIEKIRKKREFLESCGWIVEEIFNGQVEDEEFLKLIVDGIVERLIT